MMRRAIPDNAIDSDDFDKCILILKQEIDLLDKIISVQHEMRTAVVLKEWEPLDDFIAVLDEYNNEFEALEFERDRIFSAVLNRTPALPGEESFYSAVLQLPAVQRHSLTELYRDLKLRILRVRFENDALLKYVNEARAHTEQFLDQVFPGRKGKLYSSKGTFVDTDMRSIILNRSF